MFSVSFSSHDLLSHNADAYVYILEKDFNSESFSTHLKNISPDFLAIMKKRKFVGSDGQLISIPVSVNGLVSYIIVVGIGDVADKKTTVTPIERYRRAIGKAVKEVQVCGGTSAVLQLSLAQSLDVSDEYLAEQTAIIANIAQYHFNDYITDKKRKKDLITFTFVGNSQQVQEIESGIASGVIIGNAVNQARHWVDMPPTLLTPQDLVKKAQEIAKRNNLVITVFHEKEIIEKGMGGLAAVSRGSDVDCALIIVEYKAKKENAPTLCFVGKGITFDSGGLSLKPADFMETMKEDMSGAAAVICAIDALAQLDCPVNIVAIAPTSENLPSGKATKPGDIVTFYNGKTAEIKNTDAEGRLILADALSYAVKHYNPDVMVDLATLTGACARALGPFYSGLFTQNNKVKEKLQSAADISGDFLWHLPMSDDYEKAIVSTVADICNIGTSKIPAGATTAAHFLKHFVDDVPWAHIDIAGTAFDVPNISYFSVGGGTGVGVRLLVNLALHYQ